MYQWIRSQQISNIKLARKLGLGEILIGVVGSRNDQHVKEQRFILQTML